MRACRQQHACMCRFRRRDSLSQIVGFGQREIRDSSHQKGKFCARPSKSLRHCDRQVEPAGACRCSPRRHLGHDDPKCHCYRKVHRKCAQRRRRRQSRGNHEATRGHQRPTESRARVDGAINACRCDSCSRSSTYGCLQNSGDLESSLAARAARPRFRQSAPACSPASCRWHEPRRARTCRNQAQSRSRLFEHRAPFLDLMTKLWPSMSQ